MEDIARCPLLIPALNDALAELRIRTEIPAAGVGSELEMAGNAEGEHALASAEAREVLPEDAAAHLIFKTVGDFRYATAPEVFFQTNDFMLEELLATALEDAGTGETALDLYAGIGFFTIPLARRFRSVTALESDPRSSRLCATNASRSGTENIRSLCVDVGKWMPAAGSIAAPGYDCILLDPPRTGVQVEVISKIVEWAPPRVVYVSCDPQTLVRDLAGFPARDYRIARITGLDLFPQTYHFETVVSLVRR